MVTSRPRRPSARRHAPATRDRGLGRRSRTILCAAVACSLILVGCASPRPQDGIAFWSFTGIQQGEQVDRYLASNPQARIELSEIGTSSETADALTAALAGGQAPDLVLIQAEELPRFVSADQHFLDLRRFMGEDAGFDYLPWAWDAATTDSGKVIGIPTDVGGMALAYRADLFAAAGLPTEPDAVAELWPTWEDFIRVGARFGERSDASFVDNVSTTVFVNASNQLATKYYDRAGTLVYDGNPQLRAAFYLALDAHRAGISAGAPPFTPGWSAAMARGDFAVTAAPSWMLRVIKSSAPQTRGQWRVTSVPGIAGNWGGSYLAIPTGSPHAAAAWDYIAATQSAAAQNEHFIAGGPLPATRAPYAGKDITTFADPFFGSSSIGEVLTDSILNMEPVRQGPATGAINTAFLNALTSVEQGSLSTEDAWTNAIDAITAALPTEHH